MVPGPNRERGRPEGMLRPRPADTFSADSLDLGQSNAKILVFSGYDSRVNVLDLKVYLCIIRQFVECQVLYQMREDMKL